MFCCVAGGVPGGGATLLPFLFSSSSLLLLSIPCSPLNTTSPYSVLLLPEEEEDIDAMIKN